MTVASTGMGRFAPTASINPPRMITTPLGMAAPLTGCTVPPVMAYTPGASALSGSASRQRAAMKQTDRLDILTSAAGHHIICAFRHGPLQLRDERNHREDRLLRSRSLREDHEPAVRLRLAAVEQQEQDALALDEDGPHALLRLPPPRPGQDPRDAPEAAALHRPGQVYYNSTRQLVLKGADGIVFVADSQDFALDANLESMQNLEDTLKRQGVRIREIPLLIQYNKRDLPNALPVAEIDKDVNKLGAPKFESVATTGLGVEETLKGITQLVLAHLIKKYGLEGSEPVGRAIQILTPAGRE